MLLVESIASGNITYMTSCCLMAAEGEQGSFLQMQTLVDCPCSGACMALELTTHKQAALVRLRCLKPEAMRIGGHGEGGLGGCLGRRDKCI